MAYKFNSGNGGVTCDKCYVLIDANLSLKEYEEIYTTSGNDGDYCWRCKTGHKEETNNFKTKYAKKIREVNDCCNF